MIISLKIYLICSRSAYIGEISDPNVSLLDVLDFVNIIQSTPLGVTIEIKQCNESQASCHQLSVYNNNLKRTSLT